MRKTAEFVLEDPTCKAKSSDRGIPYLLVGCIFVILCFASASFLPSSLSLEPSIFIVLCLLTIVSFVLAIVFFRMFYTKERTYCDDIRKIISEQVASALSDGEFADNEKVQKWLAGMCTSNMGGGYVDAHCRCFFDGQRIITVRLRKTTDIEDDDAAKLKNDENRIDGLLVEVFSGSIEE